MTQPPVRPTLYPMDPETESEWMEAVTEKLDSHRTEFLQYLDDYVDGFHRKPPRERLQLYEATEPVFDPSIPPEITELLVEQGAYEPLVPVYDMQGLIRPPTVDPLTGMSQPALLGQAPAILGPYWQRLWAVDQLEALRCLRDYRDIRRRSDNRPVG